jgi:hypothetical protein
MACAPRFTPSHRGPGKHGFPVPQGASLGVSRIRCGLMSVERLYDELYEIAKHVGPLDEEAVQGAVSILARPRYANHPNPAALLVADLKQVIATIADDLHPEEAPGPESASRYFQHYARRYFSLEACGQQIDHRRAFGRPNKKGTVFTWMNRGVIFRVAAGLLDLWAETTAEHAPSLPGDGGGYRIEMVQASRGLPPHGPGAVQDRLEYDIETLRPDPQVIILPLPRRWTTVSALTDAEIVHPPPQPVTVTAHRKHFTAVVFGAHEPGAHLRIVATHVSWRTRGKPRVAFPVDQPINQLVLRVESGHSPEKFRWEVAFMTILGDRTVLERSDDNLWVCQEPRVGIAYELTGFTQERDRASELAEPPVSA